MFGQFQTIQLYYCIQLQLEKDVMPGMIVLAFNVDFLSELERLLYNQNDSLVTGPVKSCLTILYVHVSVQSMYGSVKYKIKKTDIQKRDHCNINTIPKTSC